MKRNLISLLFSSMFLLFLIAPTVILIIDNSADVSCFYISSEEEEKGNEISKDKELMLYDVLNETVLLDSNEIENDLEYFYKNYPKPHLNLISPPPDFYI